MALPTKYSPAQGDSLWSLTRKLLQGFYDGVFSAGGGGGGGGAVTIADGADVTLGAKADASATSGSVSAIALLKGIAGLLGGVLSVTVASAVTVQGQVGGLTYTAKKNPTISTSAYSAGFTVGGIQTLTGALVSNNGTGILESLILLDKSHQAAPMDILIFDVNPTAATTTDHATFVISTNDVNVVARVSVAASDYVQIASGESVAVKSGLGIAVQSSGSSNLYAVAVTSGTPTYTGANDLQWVWGILQD